MKKTITISVKTLFLTVFINAFMLNAQNAYLYFPDDEVVEDITAVASELTNPSSELINLTEDFTIEVSGTEGTAIIISNGNIYYSYTPEATGAVRIVKKDATVYAFEASDYKGIISSQEHANDFAEITDADAHNNPAQLLENGSFETTGDLVEGSNYLFGAPWVTNVVVPASGGIRVGTNANTVNGNYVVIWRGSGNDNYFAQEVSGIKANTAYKVIVRQVASGNAHADFRVGFGSTESNLDLSSSSLHLGNTYDGTHSTTVVTPLELSGDVFFTFKNTAANTASSGSDPVVQIDYIALVEGVSSATPGITGVSGSAYYSSSVYAPKQNVDFGAGDYYDMTSYIVNPSFEVGGLNGWINNGMKTHNSNAPADEGWSKDGNVFVEQWTSAPNALSQMSVSQTVTEIPNGTYKLLAAGHAVLQGGENPTTGAFFFAGSEQTAVNIGGEYEVADVLVVENSLTIGFKLEGTITANWAAFDNFRLQYFGVDLSALNNLLSEKIDEAQAIIDETSTPAGYNKTELQAAINNADDVEQNEDALEAAITALNVAIANFNAIIPAYEILKEALDFAATLAETNFPGKSEFDTAIADAQALYNSNDDKTAQDFLEAAGLLKAELQAYVFTQSAPADITTLLVNPDFDLEPITYTESDGAANGTALVATRVYDIPGWDEELNTDWGRIATTNYGITFTSIPDVLNGTTPPATDKAGNDQGAALKLSGSWGSPAILTQDVTLAAGRYELSFEVINMSPGLAVGENRFGFVPNEGTAVYGIKTTFESEWTTETLAFNLDSETAGKISIGIVGIAGGAGANGKLYIDNLNLTYLGVASDDAELSDLTVEGLTVQGFSSGTLSYDIPLSAGTSIVPTVVALPSNANATVEINNAEALPGTTTITVTAEDGTTVKVYTINFTVSVGISTQNFEEITVFPTVSNSDFTILTPTEQGIITVYNITGQAVQQQQITAKTTTVKINNSGVYILKIEINQHVKAIKIVKSK